jgi:hypothetical protein
MVIGIDKLMSDLVDDMKSVFCCSIGCQWHSVLVKLPLCKIWVHVLEDFQEGLVCFVFHCLYHACHLTDIWLTQCDIFCHGKVCLEHFYLVGGYHAFILFCNDWTMVELRFSTFLTSSQRSIFSTHSSSCIALVIEPGKFLHTRCYVMCRNQMNWSLSLALHVMVIVSKKRCWHE